MLFHTPSKPRVWPLAESGTETVISSIPFSGFTSKDMPEGKLSTIEPLDVRSAVELLNSWKRSEELEKSTEIPFTSIFSEVPAKCEVKPLRLLEMHFRIIWGTKLTIKDLIKLWCGH